MDGENTGSVEPTNTEIETPDNGAETASTVEPGGISDAGGSDDALSDAAYRAEMEALGVELEDDIPTDEPDLDKMKEDFEKDPEDVDNKEKEEKSEKNEEKTDEKDAKNEEKTSENMKITLKVNGEEKEYSDIAEIQQLAQHGLGANQKMQEAASIKKKAEMLFNDIKENPFEVLQHKSFGLNVRDLAEQYLFGQIQRDGMSQQERDAQDASMADSRELANYRRGEKDQAQQNEKQNEQENHTKLKQDFTNQIKANLESGGLPLTDWTQARMAGYMRQAMAKGLQPTQAQLTEIVRSDWIKENRMFLSQMQNPDDIISAIGDDTMNRVRKHQVKKFKTAPAKPAKVATGARTRGSEKPSFGTTEEMRESMGLG